MVADLSQALLRSLTPAQVRLFAVRSGWKPLTGLKRPGVVLNHPTDGLTQIHLPLSATDPEFVYRMQDAVLKLAATENRPADDLLHELALPPADVLHLRLRSHDTDAGTLPLSLGVQLFASGQQLLTAAACSAHTPQPYYRNPTFAPVTKFLERCRVGQSRNGNGYAATFAMPVTPDLSTPPLGGVGEPGMSADDLEAVAVAYAPFERKVTLTLMRALHALRSGFDTSGRADTAENVSRGVSANLCEALADLTVEDQRAVLDVSVGWSKAISRVPTRLAPPVSFAQPEFSFLAATSRQLKRMETRFVTVSGPVIELHSKPANLFEEFEGTVTVRTEIDGHARSVRFVLREADYRRACDAHRDRQSVTVNGVIAGEVSSRFYSLTHPRGFRVLSPSAPPSAGSPAG